MNKIKENIVKEHMNKVKILIDCKAYVSLGVLKEFKKGEVCEVNDFIFESFTQKSARAKSYKEEIGTEETEEETLDPIEDEETEEENTPPTNTEGDENTKIDLNKLNKVKLVEYAKEKLNFELDETLTKKLMIKKVMEVANESIE